MPQLQMTQDQKNGLIQFAHNGLHRIDRLWHRIERAKTNATSSVRRQALKRRLSHLRDIHGRYRDVAAFLVSSDCPPVSSSALRGRR